MEKQKRRNLVCWFTLHMAVVTEAVLGKSQRPGVFSRSPTAVQVLKDLCYFLLISQAHQQRAESEVRSGMLVSQAASLPARLQCWTLGFF